jgi:hypothetical protein
MAWFCFHIAPPVVSSQTFLHLTIIENNSDIYDIKLVYYKNTFQDEPSDINLVP